MSSFFLGLALWTLIQYWGHRGWHIAEARSSQSFFIVGERTHHKFWKVMGVQPNSNHEHLSPPMWLPLLVCAIVALVLGIPVGLGFTLGFLFDHYLHRWMHQWNSLSWLADFHQNHHDNPSGNFGVSLGLGWDVVFGTYLGRGLYKETGS